MTYNYAFVMSNEIIVFKVGSGKVLQEPSIVAVENIGNKKNIVAVGKEAYDLEGKCPPNIEIIRPIIDGVVVNREYAQYLMEGIVEKLNLKKFSRKNALLLLASSLTKQEKNEFVNLLYSVKMNNVAVLPALMSAFINMECQENDLSAHLILNIEDVVDIAVIANGTILQACTLDIGKDLLNIGIKDYFETGYSTNISLNTCEEIRLRLETLLANDISSITVVGNDINTALNNEITLQSQEIRPLFVDFYTKVCNGIISMLRVCNSEIVSDIKRRGVYVCGSLSTITGFEKFMKGRLSLPVYVCDDPEDCVVDGCKTLLNDPVLLDSLLQKNK